MEELNNGNSRKIQQNFCRIGCLITETSNELQKGKNNKLKLIAFGCYRHTARNTHTTAISGFCGLSVVGMGLRHGDSSPLRISRAAGTREAARWSTGPACHTTRCGYLQCSQYLNVGVYYKKTKVTLLAVLYGGWRYLLSPLV